MPAVQVHGAGRLAVVGIRVCIRGRNRVGIQPNSVDGAIVVLVVVVTEVFDSGLSLMPTVRRHRRPAELDRQKGEQDDGEDSTHGRESSGYRVFRGEGKASTPWGFTTSRHGRVRRCGSSGGG